MEAVSCSFKHRLTCINPSVVAFFKGLIELYRGPHRHHSEQLYPLGKAPTASINFTCHKSLMQMLSIENVCTCNQGTHHILQKFSESVQSQVNFSFVQVSQASSSRPLNADKASCCIRNGTDTSTSTSRKSWSGSLLYTLYAAPVQSTQSYGGCLQHFSTGS